MNDIGWHLYYYTKGTSVIPRMASHGGHNNYQQNVFGRCQLNSGTKMFFRKNPGNTEVLMRQFSYKISTFKNLRLKTFSRYHQNKKIPRVTFSSVHVKANTSFFLHTRGNKVLIFSEIALRYNAMMNTKSQHALMYDVIWWLLIRLKLQWNWYFVLSSDCIFLRKFTSYPNGWKSPTSDTYDTWQRGAIDLTISGSVLHDGRSKAFRWCRNQPIMTWCLGRDSCAVLLWFATIVHEGLARFFMEIPCA